MLHLKTLLLIYMNGMVSDKETCHWEERYLLTLYLGQGSTPVRNPLLDQQKVTSSTPQSQMTSDEEFARQLAKEDAESAAASARGTINVSFLNSSV